MKEGVYFSFKKAFQVGGLSPFEGARLPKCSEPKFEFD
jgi:hypothetical protein